MKLDLKKINKVYLSGIGGIGLSAIAYYFLNLEKQVEGSDLIESEVTRRLIEAGVDVKFKQKSNNISNDVDLLVYSSALPIDHVELVKAKELKIPSLSYFEFLGLLSKQYKTIAVTGTNGKTTTTAMLGLMLEKAGLDPTVIVGSLVPQWNSNFRLGQSDILVVEACEWQAHMLEIDPDIIVLTNIAEDHLDFYKDLTDIKNHFQKFVDKLPKDGVLVKNFDDQDSDDIKFAGKLLTFGKGDKADCHFKDVVIDEGQQKFSVYKEGKEMSKVELAVPGEYNIYNALGAMAVAKQLGVNKHQMWNAMREFKGTWRRFETVGQIKNNIVISDYAHHPESINGLLRATKDFYPDKKIIAVFQPHHHNRTKTLLDDFAKAFYLADQVIISEIYQVSGRENEKHEAVSSHDLIAKMNHNKKYYAKDFSEARKILKDINPVDAVILFIGAGDIDDLAREVID
ncbi:UDP-N-acetylmuramate--L-alanine ligase [Candidatus Parcubacteria bacterium]|jgi:UDP-N-acetylmuramate--alanine ligase|nr:UDP-N-acetylmuramate--L-alanine ligase [Candidatus Parcubacteria bacterium]